MSSKIDAYIGRSTKWPAEISALRSVLLGCGLTEEIKWGKPCYGLDGKNLAIMQEMNDFLALMFFKGALLEDADGALSSQGPNSRSAMRVCFTSVADVEKFAGTIIDFVEQAIDVEDRGLEVGPAPEPDWVDELRQRFSDDAAFKDAFESLTPGRRREYNLHFSDAKQAATRERRIDKYTSKILDGQGLRD